MEKPAGPQHSSDPSGLDRLSIAQRRIDVDPPDARQRSRDAYIGLLILLMFLVCAPAIQVLLSYATVILTYAIIPLAILLKILDTYYIRLNFELLNKFLSSKIMLQLSPTADSVRRYIADDLLGDVSKSESASKKPPSPINSTKEGPYELPVRQLSISTDSHYRSRSPSLEGSYDRLSDISPNSSPTLQHSVKSWSGSSSTRYDDRRESGGSTSSTGAVIISLPPGETELETKIEPHTENPPDTSGLTAQATPEWMVCGYTGTPIPDLFDPTLSRGSFSDPLIQEKLRTQSILYHQIHDLLAAEGVEAILSPMPWEIETEMELPLPPKIPGPPTVQIQTPTPTRTTALPTPIDYPLLSTANPTILPTYSTVNPSPPTSFIKSVNGGSKTGSPSPSPRTPVQLTYTIEGVDEARIQQLKERFPDKKALHKHLDTFASTMKRFLALTAPDDGGFWEGGGYGVGSGELGGVDREEAGGRVREKEVKVPIGRSRGISVGSRIPVSRIPRPAGVASK